MAKADVASDRGNLVRAAILRTKAARLAGPSLSGQARSAARDAMDKLAAPAESRRSGSTTPLSESGARPSSSPLSRGSRGFWTAEARLLYDLQKVCVDHERPFYAVDLLGWTLNHVRPSADQAPLAASPGSADRAAPPGGLEEPGRRPDARRRPSPVHPLALRGRPPSPRDRLRDRFRPEIGKALEQTGFEARNLPERVALQKINEELLDRVVHRGFLSMGDLRDAVSRNNRKLPDLAGPFEFFAGDRLLRADRRLATAMDGIYRGGEVYLRLVPEDERPGLRHPDRPDSSPASWPCLTAGRS